MELAGRRVLPRLFRHFSKKFLKCPSVYNRKEKKFDLYLDVKMKEEITVGFGGNVSSFGVLIPLLGYVVSMMNYFASVG